MGTHVDVINEEDAEYMEEELTKLDKQKDQGHRRMTH